MKALKNFDNTDKLKVLHEFFPEEVPQLLEAITASCTDFQEHKEAYAKDWNNGFMPFDYWFSLSEQTAELIKKHHRNMVKSSRVFSEQLSFGYTVLFVNDRIIKYADGASGNAKFKLAVALLFKTSS